jgi:hypothetical protein
VPSGPSLHSIKRASEVDLGSPLQSGGSTLRRRKDNVSTAETFLWPKLQQDVGKYISSFTACIISKMTTEKQGMYTPLPTPDRPWESISMDYMSSLSSTKKGNDCVFFMLIAFLRWRFWPPIRRESQYRPLPSSYLNEYGYILESHKPLSHIRIVSSSTHFFRASGHYWTPSSPNPLLSTTRKMSKLRSSIG